VAYSAKPLKTEAVELLVDRIARLEEVQDVGEIVRALA
jgi:hypothetical protein